MSIDNELGKGLGFIRSDISNTIDYESHGRQAVWWIRRYLKERKYMLPTDCRYLGLGVGQAYPEIELARQLRIPPTRTTFVDREFRPDVLLHIENKFAGVQLVTSDIFSYLERSPDQFVDIISAFGIEYAISRDDQIRALMRLLPRWMRTKGVVAVSFYMGKNVDHLWKQRGFEPFRGYSGQWSADLYIFNNGASLEG